MRCAQPVTVTLSFDPSLKVDGGTYLRSYDGVSTDYKSQAHPASISAFKLDQFEVTVGRFRKFLAAYRASVSAGEQLIAPGSGANPHDPSDKGWDASWNSLPSLGSAEASVVDRRASR